MPENKFLGNLFGAVVALAAVPVAYGKAACNAMKGKSAAEGWKSVMDNPSLNEVIHSCEDFGNKHSDTITTSVLKGAASVIGGAAVAKATGLDKRLK